MTDDGPSIRAVLERSNLTAAWEQVRRNKGAPGVDEVTVTRWARHWEENLDRLSHQVRTNTYRPNHPRRFRVLKPDGGWRELSILTVTDRVLQRGALNTLAPGFEATFLDGSYGYRPNRNVAQAVERVLHARDHGFGWVLDADIEDCFNQLDHAVILDGLRRVVSNVTLLRLVELWLVAGSARGLSARRRRKRRAALAGNSDGPRGIPLGAVISPLLCNIALHPLDVALERTGWPWVRYADDFVVLTRTEAEALEAWDYVEATLAGLRLQLKESKTWVTSFARGFKFLGVTFQGDTYSWVNGGQRYEVRGRNVSVLWDTPPPGYAWEF
jgi:group II intron reverse transcriptase/maturase